MSKKLRIYVDTSVFGGCFDEGFEDASNALFDNIRSGKFILVISDTTRRELGKAPEKVRKLLVSLPSENIEKVIQTEEVFELRDAYLEAGVVGPASFEDAEHIATASVHFVDFVVSWNFKHIVHFDKIRGYQAINRLNGYNRIEIYSPLEVASYE